MESNSIVERRSISRESGPQHEAYVFEKMVKRLTKVKAGELGIEEEAKKLAAEFLDLENGGIRDPLTGALNRKVMSLLISEELKSSDFPRVAVLFIDIDHFKEINDKEPQGHQAGDNTLKEMVKMIKEILGDKGEVGRWGGEEFIILLPNTNTGKMVEIAAKLGSQVQTKLAKLAGLQRDKVTLSVGGTMSLPDDNLDKIIKRADEQMYKVKQSGRNGLIRIYGNEVTRKLNF